MNVKKRKSNTFTVALRERNPNAPLAAPAPNPNGRRRHIPAPLVIPGDQADYGAYDFEDDENTEQSLSNASVTSPSTETSSTTPKLTKADARAAKRAAKSAKSQRKSSKNQTKLAHVVHVKAAAVDNTAIILHGPSFIHTTSKTGQGDRRARHPLASDKSVEDVMERNRRYVASIHEHKRALLREIGGKKKQERRRQVKKQQTQQKDYKMSRSRRSIVTADDEDDELKAAEEEESRFVDAIIGKLGITPPSTPTSMPTTPKRLSTSSASGGSSSHGHSKQALLAQLRVAIAEDLQKHENEQRHTLIRAGGFWRYVGRQVFDRMCEVGEKIDWRTGEIKKGDVDEAEEEEKAEDLVEDEPVAAAAADDADEQDNDDNVPNLWANRRDDR